MPLASTVRYFTASRHSEYLVAIPKKAAIHIQNKAPGPPALIAVATPTMLPVPTVAASAVHNALKLFTSPLPSFLALKIRPKACGSLKTCSNFRRKVSRIPVPTKSTRSGGPQTNASISFKISNMIQTSPFKFPLITYKQIKNRSIQKILR